MRVAGIVVVQRAADAKARLVQHMSIDHRGRDVFVSKKLLHGADVVARLEQMGSKTMPKSVATGSFAQAGGADGEFDCVLEVLLRGVVTAGFPAARINTKLCCGENILPCPGPGGVDVFAIQSMR